MNAFETSLQAFETPLKGLSKVFKTTLSVLSKTFQRPLQDLYKTFERSVKDLFKGRGLLKAFDTHLKALKVILKGF